MLELVGYTCLRGEVPLFRPLDVRLTHGQTMHLMAANGGGKTTLLRALYGMAIDVQGTLLWQGKACNSVLALRSQCAYMNDRAGVFEHLTTAENLAYMLLLHGYQANAKTCAKALAWAGLGHCTGLLVGKLSKGQKKRLHLARLHLSQRNLWLLDEPFDGLDSDGRGLLAGLLDRHTQLGRLAIYSSHTSSERSYQSHLQVQLLPLQA